MNYRITGTGSCIPDITKTNSDFLKNWGTKAQDHVKKNFTIDIMLDNLESYFREKINNSIRKK